MVPCTTLLSLLAVVFIHLFFAMAMLLYNRQEPLWVLGYFIFVVFYSALYFRRWLRHRNQLGGIYQGLGYWAVALGLLLSALFFYSVGAGLPLPLAVGVWLGLAIAAYFLYRVIVLPLNDEAATAVQVRAPV